VEVLIQEQNLLYLPLFVAAAPHSPFLLLCLANTLLHCLLPSSRSLTHTTNKYTYIY
jgi:hypothetical protein